MTDRCSHRKEKQPGYVPVYLLRNMLKADKEQIKVKKVDVYRTW